MRISVNQIAWKEVTEESGRKENQNLKTERRKKMETEEMSAEWAERKREIMADPELKKLDDELSKETYDPEDMRMLLDTWSRGVGERFFFCI